MMGHSTPWSLSTNIRGGSVTVKVTAHRATTFKVGMTSMQMMMVVVAEVVASRARSVPGQGKHMITKTLITVSL